MPIRKSTGNSDAKTKCNKCLFIFLPKENFIRFEETCSSRISFYTTHIATQRRRNVRIEMPVFVFQILCFFHFISRSNQHYHQHHQQQRTNSGSGNTGGGGGGIQHSMHTNRQTYHNGQMAPGGGKGPYQYHTNASAMNGNGRVAILHKPTQMEPPSHPHPIENIENVEPVIVTSEEKHFDEMVINRPPECANITTAKNKTAMCLINELVRSNKVRWRAANQRRRRWILFNLFLQLSHQYRVINEKGQPHQKEFTVCLELGDEKYTASGTTIKMAQQAAAAEALSKTKHQRPAGRQTRSTFSRKNTGDKPGQFPKPK